MSVQSPIAPELLRPVLAPSLGTARTLPAAAYTSQAVFDWEAEHFFEAGWVCIGRADDLADGGDQKAFRIGSEGILVVRAMDGELHGFYNTCRHRGHELLEPGTTRNLRAIKCPYHAWVYRLDGSLGAAPRFGDLDGFDRSQYPLVAARIQEWRGWIFVNADGAAPEFSSAVGDLDALISGWEPERLFVGASHDYVVDANWKTVTENYHECYHCPVIHPELCRVSPPKSGENYPAGGMWVGGSMDLRDGMATMSLDGASHGAALRGLDAKGLRTVIYVNIFPNVLLSLHPDYVMVHRLVPVAADRTRIECTWAFAPESLARPGFDPGYAVEFWDITNRQDWHACESVQRGLSSPHAVPGPLSSEEDAVYQFVTMVARGYQGEPLWNPGLPVWSSAAPAR
jgi:glycine betaine catabolism A